MRPYWMILGVLLGLQLKAQEPGDLAVVGISTSEMMYISLAYIPEGTQLHITDRQWNGSSWDPGADGGTGNITLTIGSGGMPANSYLLIQNLTTTPTVVSGGNYFSNATTSNSSAFTFDFQGSNTGTCTILTVHSASSFSSDPTGTYIWVIALGNYNVLGSTYGIPENCAVNRANNANVSATSLDANATTASKEEALNYLDNGSNWSNGTTASSLVVPLIADIDLTNTTWNGSSWDFGAPTTSSDAIIAGAYNTATDGALTVGDSLTIQDGVTLTVDDVTNSDLKVYGNINTSTSGVLVLEGSSSGFATVPNSTTFSGTGQIQIQVQVNQVGWHHLSAPGSVTLGDLSFNNGMTLSYSGSTANVYTWDASTSGWVTTSSGADMGAAGYAMYFASSQLMTIPISPASLNNVQETDNLDYHDPMGALPGNSATGWSTSVEDGWNLVRNPFPEYLNWNLLDDDLGNLTDMDASVYIWDPTSGGGTGSYVSYSSAVGGDFGISPIQAFFVRSSSGTGSLTKPLDVRTTTGNEYLGKTDFDDVERFRLSVSVDGYSKTHSFAFMDGASMKKDIFDTYAFQGGTNVPYFYSTTADSIRVDNQALPMYFDVLSTYLTCYSPKQGEIALMTIDDRELSASALDVYLVDLHLMNVVDLRSQSTYSFTIDTLAPTQRFKLVMSNNGIDIPEIDHEGLKAYKNGEDLVLNLQASGSWECDLINWDGAMVENHTAIFSDNQFILRGLAGFRGVVLLHNGKEYHYVKILN